MSERPGGPNRPDRRPEDGGRPGYGWLWGEGSDAAQSAPEPTQRVRRQPAPGGQPPYSSSQPSRTTAPAPGAEAGDQTMRLQQTAAPGARPSRPAAAPAPIEIAPEPGRPSGPGGPRGGSGGGGGGGGGPRLPRTPKPWTAWRRIRWAITAVLVLVLVWVGALVWVALSGWGDVKQVAWEPSGNRPSNQGGTTILVVGSDSRAGLSAAQRKLLHTGDAAGQRTDTIKLLHYGGGKDMLLTIPRDSLVDIPGHGTTKINAAFAWGGPKLLVKTIEQDTGIRIDGYVETGFGGLVNLVDAVGGIQICPKQAMNDPLAGLHVKKGCQNADGVTALAFARSRHTQSLGDLARGFDQDQVISAVAHKLNPVSLANPFKLHTLLSKFSTAFKVGQGMSKWQAFQTFRSLRAISAGKGLQCGTPISDMAVHWDPTRSKQMFHYVIENKVSDIPSGLCTPSGLPKSVTG